MSIRVRGRAAEVGLSQGWQGCLRGGTADGDSTRVSAWVTPYLSLTHHTLTFSTNFPVWAHISAMMSLGKSMNFNNPDSAESFCCGPQSHRIILRHCPNLHPTTSAHTHPPQLTHHPGFLLENHAKPISHLANTSFYFTPLPCLWLGNFI